jgi:hypothetical protein
MDNLVNTKIKITKNTLAKGGFLGNKPLKSGLHTNALLNNRFYSSKASETKEDKYLSYITPLKAKKSISKIINIQNKKSFSAMDIETMDFNGKELPISISIKTKNITKIFIIDFKPCFRPNSKPYFKPCSIPCYKPYFKPRFIQHCKIDIAIKDL